MYWPVTWVISMKWILNIISKRSNISVEVFFNQQFWMSIDCNPLCCSNFCSSRSDLCGVKSTPQEPDWWFAPMRRWSHCLAKPYGIRYLWACQQQDYHCHIFFLWAMPQNQIKSYMQCSVIFHYTKTRMWLKLDLLVIAHACMSPHSSSRKLHGMALRKQMLSRVWYRTGFILHVVQFIQELKRLIMCYI